MNERITSLLLTSMSFMILTACGNNDFVGGAEQINSGDSHGLRGKSGADAGDTGDTDDSDSSSKGGSDQDDSNGHDADGGIDSSDGAADEAGLGSDGDEGAGAFSLTTRNLCSNAGESHTGSSVSSASGVTVKLVNANTSEEHTLKGNPATIRQNLLDQTSVRLRANVEDGAYFVVLCDAADASSCRMTTSPDEAGNDIKKYFLKYGSEMRALGVSASPIRIEGNKLSGSAANIWTMFDDKRRGSDASQCDENSSPLVFDFSGRGIELTAPSVSFDIKADGFKHTISWFTNAQQMPLVLDINNNGIADDGGELFGDHTKLADGTLAANGFAALAQYDADNNLAIDSKDPIFAMLRLWSDKNLNGKTDAGELLTLAGMQVESVSVAYVSRETRDAYNNIMRERSTAHMTDGTAVEVVDVWFRINGMIAAR